MTKNTSICLFQNNADSSRLIPLSISLPPVLSFEFLWFPGQVDILLLCDGRHGCSLLVDAPAYASLDYKQKTSVSIPPLGADVQYFKSTSANVDYCKYKLSNRNWFGRNWNKKNPRDDVHNLDRNSTGLPMCLLGDLTFSSIRRT